jgi:hypothetical protein
MTGRLDIRGRLLELLEQLLAWGLQIAGHIEEALLVARRRSSADAPSRHPGGPLSPAGAGSS